MKNIEEQTAPSTGCGGNSNIAVPPKRRKRKRLIPGIPNYSRTATPKQVLKAAQDMPQEEARQYLLRYVRYHGWGEIAINEINTEPFIRMSIYCYLKWASELREFNFSHMEATVGEMRGICCRVSEGDMRVPRERLFAFLSRWERTSDRLKAFNLWRQVFETAFEAKGEAAIAQASAN